MMQIKRRRPAARRLVLACSSFAFLSACEDPPEGGVASAFMQELDAPVVFGMASYLSASGVREGRVEADTAFTFADSAKVDLRGMRVVFYDEDGRPRATVTGRTGEWNQDTDRMIALGDVVLTIASDSSKLESAEIHYDPEADRIWSDSATVRTMADGTVTRGSAFESDIDFTNVRIQDIRGGAARIF